MDKVTFLCFLCALSSLAMGRKKFVALSSQNEYSVHSSKEEANHYENHYDYSHKPYPYKFGYDIKDEKGNLQYHKEEGDEYNVKKGSYGYTDAYGVYRHVDYIADHMGFRAKIRTNEPGTASYHPAHVSIYSEPPPSHVYSAYKSGHSGYDQVVTHPVYVQPTNSPYDNSIHNEYEKTVEYEKPEHRGKPEPDAHQQQNGHEESYPKLDQKYSYVPVYVSNNIEYND